MLLTLPINALLQNLLGAATLTVSLPITYAAILAVLSIVITVIGGLFPAKSGKERSGHCAQSGVISYGNAPSGP